MRFLAFFLAFSAFFAIGCGQFAYAKDRLDFFTPVSESSKIKINNFIETNLKQPPNSIVIAATDLNGDNLDEFIIRNKDCALEKECRFTILAEANEKIISLGTIEAHELALGTTYNQGIRSLWAFKNSVNDYDYLVYVWEPRQARYMMESK